MRTFISSHSRPSSRGDVPERSASSSRRRHGALPRGWPKNPCNNFAGLLDGRYTENCVDGILGARVAMLTEALLESGRRHKPVACADKLKRAGLTYRDIR